MARAENRFLHVTRHAICKLIREVKKQENFQFNFCFKSSIHIIAIIACYQPTISRYNKDNDHRNFRRGERTEGTQYLQ